MGIDITKLALTAARAAIGEPQKTASRKSRKRRRIRDRLPSVTPMLVGAAGTVTARAVVRSRGSDWLQSLQDRLDLGEAGHDDEDREPDLDEPTEARYDEDEEPDEVERDEENEETDDVAADEDTDEPEDSGDSEPKAEEAVDESDDPRADAPTRRATAVAPLERMSPVRLKKLAASAGRGTS